MWGMARNQHNDELQTVTLESGGGLRATILNLGAAIAAIEVPAANGLHDVVLSYTRVEDYVDDPYFMGVTVGPFANRIADGRFELDGQEYLLHRNEQATGHCLHGGETGLHRQVFDLQPDDSGTQVTCRVMLSGGAGGFPGQREVIVVYQVVNGFELLIDYAVTSDSNTVISLANHAYFNLGGEIEDHEIQVFADAYTPVDDTSLPTGEKRSVADSVFDLRAGIRIGQRKYDHNFVLAEGSAGLGQAAILRSPASGLALKLYTTQPGLHVYTGDGLRAPFRPRNGICLEAQGYPDAPNQQGFPSTRLAAGEVYRQQTIYRFEPVSV